MHSTLLGTCLTNLPFLLYAQLFRAHYKQCGGHQRAEGWSIVIGTLLYVYQDDLMIF